jgi:hypothetical protein
MDKYKCYIVYCDRILVAQRISQCIQFHLQSRPHECHHAHGPCGGEQTELRWMVAGGSTKRSGKGVRSRLTSIYDASLGLRRVYWKVTKEAKVW